MNILAIIPARGGSKGIPRKNVQPVCGKPMIGWTIDAANNSRHVDRVVVSTDDDEIAATASCFDADVVRRPAEISGDSASSEAALLHTLDYLRETDGYTPDLLVFLQCTSPLTAAEDIDGTIDALLREKADTALAVADFHYFLWKHHAGEAVGINHDKTKRQMRQDREPQFLETGAVYVMKTDGFLKSRHRFFGQTALYEMPPDRCLEIDDPVDLNIAEMLLRERRQVSAAEVLPDTISAIVFDFDGVFTDNRVLVDQSGGEAVWCNRGDGWGFNELKTHGLPTLVLSTEENPVVSARCKKLNLPCLHGISDKASALAGWLDKVGVDACETIFLGNDANDVGCLEMVGCAAVVADAHPAAKRVADLILSREGGNGAVRELTDLVIQKLQA